MVNMNKGWVKLWRDQFTHEISDKKPWCDGYAWSYVYSRANFKPGIVNFRNQYIPVERSQFITSKLKLQEIFGWSQRRVNSFLTSLKVRGMCTTRVTNRFIVITVCNYDKYQSMTDEDVQTDVTTDVRTGDEQVMTEKKKVNEKEKTPAEILSEISELEKRYSDQETINQAFQAISSTRKSNRIADSVKLSILQSWERYPVESVMTGIKTYLEKGYADQGKKEAYLLGIIRNLKPEDNTGEQVMKSTGSYALDEHYRNQGFTII